MSTLYDDCVAEYHEANPVGEYYKKYKHNISLLDWLLGTEFDQSKTYVVIACMHCGASKEIICEDRTPEPEEIEVETVVHRVTPPEDK